MDRTNNLDEQGGIDDRLLAVQREIDSCLARLSALYAEERVIVRQLLPQGRCAEVDLIFDDANRTVKWSGGTVKLPPKPYLLVKTLWFAAEHRLELADIEEAVWQEELECEAAVERHTILTLIGRTSKKLAVSFFPYCIEPFAVRVTVSPQEKADVHNAFPKRKNFTSTDTAGYVLCLCAAHRKKLPAIKG
ncbi:MAG: hypothetical protein LBT89_12265 [Planctomycetaceae bacterium]|jgi:hypothetical protein|nr:hypothetical protein [Planctomycetaceae bacterium]